tara:strand:- start:945 stop:1856 length:912 start_codon:yes stop_codon:yes gene_type:complete
MDLFKRKNPLSTIPRDKSETKNISATEKTPKLKLSSKEENISICEGIELKKFPIDTSLKIKFMFNKVLFDNKDVMIISLKNIDNTKYILLSSTFERMYLMTLFICKYKIKPGFVRYSLTNSLNPFSNTKTQKEYYYIIFKSDKLFSLKEAVLQKHINLFDFKKGIIKFLKSYSLLNKTHNFVYNNINSESLYVNYIGKDKNIIMFDYTYSYDSYTQRNAYQKKYDKKFYEMKELYDLNEIYEKLEGNYDLICIIFIINICNSYLNEIPKELILNQDDIKFFNSNAKLYEKINILLKKDFLKIL